MSDEDLGIYIHIPFCKQKCLYCDFPSYAGAERYMDMYFSTLLKEIDGANAEICGYKIKSIYIGGGTPTYFKTDYIGAMLGRCKELFNVDEDVEITIEANPGTVDREKLIALRNFGINRLSMGLQAWQTAHLKALGRMHDSEQVKKDVGWARDAGFENISVDLMFGLPNHTMREWMETLKRACDLGIEHISAYSLKVEKETPLYTMMKKGLIEPIDEDIERQMYREGVLFLENNGYKQYEISNFAREGFRSYHNLIYWRDREYIGFGCGAHSYMNNIRWCNHSSINQYIDAMAKRGDAVEHREVIDKDIERFEMIMMGLRLTEGVNKNEFLERFGRPMSYYYAEPIERLKADGLMAEDDLSIYMTPRGMDIHNTVLLAFLDYI